MNIKPINDPTFIPMIAPKYTPNIPIFNVIPMMYAKAMLNTSSLNIVSDSDLNPDPTP